MLWRGTILLLIAQGFSLVSGYAINIFLARKLGPEGYGTFGVVYSLLMIFELFVVAGIPNALQRFIGEKPTHSYSLHRYLFKKQLLFGIFFVIFTFLIAPVVANIFNDSRISFLLRIAILDVIVFGLYWYYNSFPLGQRQFERHTIIVACYSVFKLIFIVVLVQNGFSIVGALVGNILGSTAGMLAGLLLLKIKKLEQVIDEKKLNNFIISNIIYSIGFNLFFYIDLWAVKYFMNEETVGYYNAAATLGRIPYFLSVGLSLALLPNLSLAVGKNDDKKIDEIIKQSLRVSFLILLPLIAIVLNFSKEITSIVFGSDYQSADLFRILFIAMSGLAIFIVLNAINIAKAGMNRISILTVVLVALDFIFNFLFVPRYGAFGAAFATTLTMGIGVILSSILVFRQYERFMEFKTLFRLLIASAIIYLISSYLPIGNIFIFGIEFAVLGVVYLALLFLIGEIQKQEVLGLIKNLAVFINQR